jgi:hypothetical protein
VRRRKERHQVLLAMLATAVLSLTAPAAFWIGTQTADPFGWILWGLVWIQSAASIVYVNLRLEQRRLRTLPDFRERARLGIGAIRFATFNVVLVACLAMAGRVPSLLLAPYMLQWLETIWGTVRSVSGGRPAAIGIRQLIVSILFTILFALAY